MDEGLIGVLLILFAVAFMAVYSSCTDSGWRQPVYSHGSICMQIKDGCG